MANVTIKDLAQRLGVSPATISMVLNGRRGVSEATRSKVMAELKASGYPLEKHSAAQKKSGTVTLAMCRKDGQSIERNPFFATLIESIEQEAAASGYQLSVHYLAPGAMPPPSEGMILLATAMAEEDMLPFRELSFPLVALDNSFPGVPINTVSIDNAGGIQAAVVHLLERGHKRIGYLTRSLKAQNFFERAAAFHSALEALGLPSGDVVQLPGLNASPSGLVRFFQERKPGSTAYLADNDFTALSTVTALHTAGYRVGEDISLVGFDDLPFSRMSQPPLTTVRVFNDRLGRAAVRRLVELIREPNQPYAKISVGVELKERESVRSGPAL